MAILKIQGKVEKKDLVGNEKQMECLAYFPRNRPRKQYVFCDRRNNINCLQHDANLSVWDAAR